MAHNFESNPDLSVTSGHFSAFSIDFCADYAPRGTYWALCNWQMDTTNLAKKYTVYPSDFETAYTGLQNTEDGFMGLLSFWQIRYKDENGVDRILNAHRVYPDENDEYFDNEGSGTKCLVPYDWKPGNWYRLFLQCYDDELTGNTMVESWVCDLAKDKWTLLSRYDTGLEHSCFTSGMSQFMENYAFEDCCEVRSVKLKNIAVLECGRASWTPIKRSTLWIDTYSNDKKGSFAIGKEDDCFWGITCGYGEDKAEPDSDIHMDCIVSQSIAPEIPGSIMKVVIPEKKDNPLTLKKNDKTFRRSKLKRKKTFSIKISDSRGELSFICDEASKEAGIKVSGKGKVTLPARCKKGTYIITISAAENDEYKTKEVAFFINII